MKGSHRKGEDSGVEERFGLWFGLWVAHWGGLIVIEIQIQIQDASDNVFQIYVLYVSSAL